jgi:multidrug resistance efflux pump
MSETTDNHLAEESPAAGAGSRTNGTSLSDRVRSLRLSQRSGTPAKRLTWLPWVVVIAVLLASTAIDVTALTSRRPDSGDQAAATPAGSPGSVTPTTASSGDAALESKGNIVPVHQIQVSPKVSGMVLKLNFEEGQKVKEGDVLAELEDINYRDDRDHAEAALREAEQNLAELTRWRKKEIEQAKARWEEALVQSKQLGLDRDRSSRLRNGDALAARDWEQAESAYLAMVRHGESLRLDYDLLIHGPRDAKIEAAQKHIAQLKADLHKADWELDNCKVKAPISGTILSKKAEKGNIVNPIAFNISASLCDMADLRDLEVDLNIQERDVSRVFKGQRCKIRPEAFPDRVYEGHVSRLMPIADRAKGAVPVRVKVELPADEPEGQYLRPEMGVIVKFLKKP